MARQNKKASKSKKLKHQPRPASFFNQPWYRFAVNAISAAKDATAPRKP